MLGPKMFRDSVKYGRKLARAADVAVRDVLAVRKGERALIVTNPDEEVMAVSQATFDALNDAGATASLIVQPRKTQVDTATPEVLSALRGRPDIAISISSEKLGKDPEAMAKPYVDSGVEYTHVFDHLLHGAKTMKAFWSPSITRDMFERTVPVDYAQMRERASRLKKAMDKGERVRVTAPGGTDITISIKGRSGFLDDGNFTKGGLGGNLPAGEVYVSPALGGADGVIAYDGSISSHDGEIIIRKPIVCRVQKGFVTKVSGGNEAAELEVSLAVGERMAREFAAQGKIPKAMLGHYVKNARNIGELGIGLNPAARIVGNMLEDEKVLSTCHFAIGSNYDEDAKAMIHLDGLVKRPTITVHGRSGPGNVVMEDGQLVE